MNEQEVWFNSDQSTGEHDKVKYLMEQRTFSQWVIESCYPGPASVTSIEVIGEEGRWTNFCRTYIKSSVYDNYSVQMNF